MKQAQVLSERDVKRVLAAIAKRSYSSRDRAMFQLSYLAGMRVGEIAQLRVCDVYQEQSNVNASTIHVVGGCLRSDDHNSF